MTDILLQIHSILRWIVLLAIVFTIYRAWIGLLRKRQFSRIDNALRHWTATGFHIQLMVGILLFTQSPLVKWFWNNTSVASQNFDSVFFGWLHELLMVAAIVVITIGSSLAKRKKSDREKFATVFVWFTIALIIIIVAIPWPFSPLATRPYIR